METNLINSGIISINEISHYVNGFGAGIDTIVQLA